jgi:hypothetical protein
VHTPRVFAQAEKLRSELQIGYDEVHQSLEETAGRLGASELQNRQSKEDMSRLLAEIGERQMNREARVSELFNMQWQSLSRLRDMKMKLQSLEHDATNISQFCTNIKQAGEVASSAYTFLNCYAEYVCSASLPVGRQCTHHWRRLVAFEQCGGSYAFVVRTSSCANGHRRWWHER